MQDPPLLEGRDNASVTIGRALENIRPNTRLAGALDPRLEFRRRRHGHALVRRQRVAADGDLVDADPLEFLDDPSGGPKLAPARFGMTVELPP